MNYWDFINKFENENTDTDLLAFNGLLQFIWLGQKQRKAKFKTAVTELMKVTANRVIKNRPNGIGDKFAGSGYAIQCEPILGKSKSFRVLFVLRSDNVQETKKANRGVIPFAFSKSHTLNDIDDLENLLSGLESHIRGNIHALEYIMQKLAFGDEFDNEDQEIFENIVSTETNNLIQAGKQSQTSKYVKSLVSNLKAPRLPLGLSALFNFKNPIQANTPIISRGPK